MSITGKSVQKRVPLSYGKTEWQPMEIQLSDSSTNEGMISILEKLCPEESENQPKKM